jgi:hypothetical protein
MTDPRAQVPQLLAEKVLLGGDLSVLSPTERLAYYDAVCKSLNLNALTRPFEYLTLGKGDEKKMVLYARKDCTDQLRTERGVSVQIVSREILEGVAVVTAQAKDMTERTDESIGAVPIVQENGEWKHNNQGKPYFQSDGTYKPLSPLERANAIMKAETKAKRRVTLSICGLGMFDESEIDGVPGAKRVFHAENDKPVTHAEILERFEEPQDKPADGADASNIAEVRSQQGSDAPAKSEEASVSSDDPAEPYRAKLRTCIRSNDVINKTYMAIPETIRQDCFDEYTAQLKSLGNKRKQMP